MYLPRPLAICSLLSIAWSIPEGVFQYTPTEISSLQNYDTASNQQPFDVYNENFWPLLGSAPRLANILNATNASFPQFHEAGILIDDVPNPVFVVTSNQYNASGSPSTGEKAISISRVSFNGTWHAEIIVPSGYPIRLANGGTKYNSGVVILDQGTLTEPGGLVYMDIVPPYSSHLLIDNYYGQPFNSPNDVIATSDGALWFTDPAYGNWQGIRPSPVLPAQVYRYHPNTNNIRVVADGFIAPNGLTFSPDERTLYITDAAGNSSSLQAPRTIYAFDVETRRGEPIVSNRRVFAMPESGIPDGIKTDQLGNVYAGCGDGVNVWDARGILLGKIKVPGGNANLVLGTGRVWLLSGAMLWEAEVSGVVV